MISQVKIPCFCNPVRMIYKIGDSKTYALWGSVHHLWSGNLHSQTHIRKTGGNHDNPNNLDRRNREDRLVAVVLKGQTNKQSEGQGNVLSEKMQNELLDIVENATSFLDAVND
jgi:hypothetical protein